MNEHILKVMVWLKNPNFYSQEVMQKNDDAAYSAADVSYYAAADSVAAFAAAVFAAVFAANAAVTYAAAASAADRASYWVNKFFKLSGDDRQQYEQEVNRRLAA